MVAKSGRRRRRRGECGIDVNRERCHMQLTRTRLSVKYFNLAIDVSLVRSRSSRKKPTSKNLKFEHDGRLGERHNADINLSSIVIASYFL